MDGLELVCYRGLTHGWRSVPETYTCFTMIDSLEGDVEVMSRGTRVPGRPGALTVGQPGEAHVLRPRTRMRGEFRILRLSNQLHAQLRPELGDLHAGSPFPRGPLQHAMIGLAFTRLHLAIAGGEIPVIQERLLGFLALLLVQSPRRDIQPEPADPRGVELARELLHARFAAGVSLDELAQVAGMNRFTLLRAFSRELGTTPHAYQVQLRVSAACRLIARGLPLADVALTVGYSEQSALNRSFKRLVGTTPDRYACAIT